MSEDDAVAGAADEDMTSDELEAALGDESHHRHAEAQRVNNELAEQLRPALDRFRQTMMKGAGIEDSSARLTGLTTGDSGGGVTRRISRPSMPEGLAPRPPLFAQQAQRDFERQNEQLAQATRDLHESRARRQEFEDERAARAQDVLEAMNANLMRLNSQMSQVDARLVAGNHSSDEMGKRTLRVARWTLIATVVSIMVALISVGGAVWLSR